ncbi:TetR/AcrR family transcriptional regulator [Paenarthrobacter nitroguajacolicus]|uniref:TetR/AcrR family transcriptional regulator n=1 Tax=Paenarthrobacter nitroguajacolicus TaxID=211146 RepID=UPI00405415A2
MVKNATEQDPGQAIAAGIELLIRQGYAATPVEDLADAIGVSRSTFFRRFGSKEDMVFADHERILRRVDENLAGAVGDPLAAVENAALMIFDQHVTTRRTAILRNQLLHEVQVLRDRELVTAHRYERAFRQYLLSTLPDDERRACGASAFAAGLVALHNRVLRQWLLEVRADSDDSLNETLSRLLRQEVRALAELFRPVLFPDSIQKPSRPAVVVTVVDQSASTEEILKAVAQALA